MMSRDNIRSKGIVQWLSGVTNVKTGLGSLGIDSRLWAQNRNNLSVCVGGVGDSGQCDENHLANFRKPKISFSAVC